MLRLTHIASEGRPDLVSFSYLSARKASRTAVRPLPAVHDVDIVRLGGRGRVAVDNVGSPLERVLRQVGGGRYSEEGEEGEGGDAHDGDCSEWVDQEWRNEEIEI